MSFKKIFAVLVLFGLIVAGILGYRYYTWIQGPSVTNDLENPYLFIYPQTGLNGLTKQLTDQGFIEDAQAFNWVADKMKFDDAAIKPGRYKISGGISNRTLIQKLRLGKQEPLQVTIQGVHRFEELGGLVSKQLMFDSTELISYLSSQAGVNDFPDAENLISLFIPNTYEFYWNTSPESFVKRMRDEQDEFWNPERVAAADELGYSAAEIYTLASIVERETQNQAEKSTIAGVYINRLRRGIPLQADPTALFAWGTYNIRRVLNRHLEIDSPYNTYLNKGLPPGPITMPGINTISAVLNAEKHDYIFFCAKPGYEGSHLFATNLAGHNRNARVYRRWLDSEGIR